MNNARNSRKKKMSQRHKAVSERHVGKEKIFCVLCVM